MFLCPCNLFNTLSPPKRSQTRQFSPAEFKLIKSPEMSLVVDFFWKSGTFFSVYTKHRFVICYSMIVKNCSERKHMLKRLPLSTWMQNSEGSRPSILTATERRLIGFNLTGHFWSVIKFSLTFSTNRRVFIINFDFFSTDITTRFGKEAATKNAHQKCDK